MQIFFERIKLWIYKTLETMQCIVFKICFTTMLNIHVEDTECIYITIQLWK